jgi:hypothetical protein
LTPAKRDQVVAGGEWLDAAGTVHETTLALGGLSYGKRLLHLGLANGSAEVLRKAPPTPSRSEASDLESTTKKASSARLRVHCLRATAGIERLPRGSIKSTRPPARKLCPSSAALI